MVVHVSTHTIVTYEDAIDINQAPTTTTTVTATGETPTKKINTHGKSIDSLTGDDDVEGKGDDLSKEAEMEGNGASAELIVSKEELPKDSDTTEPVGVGQEAFVKDKAGVTDEDKTTKELSGIGGAEQDVVEKAASTEIAKQNRVTYGAGEKTLTAEKVAVAADVEATMGTEVRGMTNFQDGKAEATVKGLLEQELQEAIHHHVSSKKQVTSMSKVVAESEERGGSCIMARSSHQGRRRSAYLPMRSPAQVSGLERRRSVGGPTAYGLVRDSERDLPVTDPAWE